MSLLRAHPPTPLVAFDHCRIPLKHFAFVGRDDRVARLHQLALEIDPLAPRAGGGWKRLVARLEYLAVTLRQVARYHARWGRHVRRTHGVSLRRQWADAWHCMWRQNQLARHYYWRKLFLLPDRAAWLDNLEHRQVNTLLEFFNRHVPATRIAHKLQFAEHCARHALPTPPVLAAWAEGGKLALGPAADPRCDVFAKPTSDYGSVGAMPIEFDNRSGEYRFNGTRLQWPGLLDAIAAELAADRGYLLQPRLRSSAASAVYGAEELSNVRIVTGRTVRGAPEPIAAVVRIPSSFTTQGHDRDVMLASIDVHTGRMGPAMFREITLPQFSDHPDTGHRIEGEPFPNWPAMLELARRAHATCPWMPFVGWDVVDTDRGLMLLEANSNWGGDSAQLPGAPALGRTRFPEIYLEWFEHLRLGRALPTEMEDAPAAGRLA
ncbi:MAG TPA: sugar-transfer associated ATP-grasp domain-containing protein [Opitutus sp.]|nr:sugar-transfer associated ATP-grasp domain-containing protein [Opitutus sp.]